MCRLNDLFTGPGARNRRKPSARRADVRLDRGIAMLGPGDEEPTTPPTSAMEVAGDTVTFTGAVRFALIRLATSKVITKSASHVPSGGTGH